LGNDLVKINQIGIILDVGIGGQDFFGAYGQQVFQLVAERGTDVVYVGLEGHSKQTDRKFPKVIPILRLFDEK
jgi:hypothetical protein